MQCYRLKHLPTGLYFIPSREIKVNLKDKNGNTVQRTVKSNLSKKGKVYQQYPTIKWLGRIFYTHIGEYENEFSGLPFTKSQRVQPGEWIVETV